MVHRAGEKLFNRLYSGDTVEVIECGDVEIRRVQVFGAPMMGASKYTICGSHLVRRACRTVHRLAHPARSRHLQAVPTVGP